MERERVVGHGVAWCVCLVGERKREDDREGDKRKRELRGLFSG